MACSMCGNNLIQQFETITKMQRGSINAESVLNFVIIKVIRVRLDLSLVMKCFDDCEG